MKSALSGLFFLTAVLMACENDRGTVEELTAQDSYPIEATRDAIVYYTEGADRKAVAKAPLMERYVGEQGYTEMNEGIAIDMFDSLGNISSKLTANYAIDKNSEQIMEAKNDVVIVNDQGEQLNTEHLIWDRKKRKIYSEVFVKITTQDEIIMGDGFESNEDFSKYKILKPKGTISKIDDEDD